MIVFSCPGCKNEMQSVDTNAGSKVICPSCGHRLQVPAPPAEPPPPSQMVLAPLVTHTPDPLALPPRMPPAPLPEAAPARRKPIPTRNLVFGGMAVGGMVLCMIALVIGLNRSGSDKPHDGEPRSGPEATLAKELRANAANSDPSTLRWDRWGPTLPASKVLPLLKPVMEAAFGQEEVERVKTATHFVRLRYRYRRKGDWRIEDVVFAVGPKGSLAIGPGSDDGPDGDWPSFRSSS